MKKNKIIVSDWEAEGIKDKTKTTFTFLVNPQPTENVMLLNVPISAKFPIGTAFENKDGSLTSIGKDDFNIGTIMHCENANVNIKIIGGKVCRLNEFTDEMAVNEGIGSLYPKSHFGGEGYYLPDKILEQTALECFKYWWNNNAGVDGRPTFESNPYVIIYEFKTVK